MTSSTEPQPPKFRQGPRDFCLSPEATLKIPSPGAVPSKPELHLESMIIPLGVMIAGAVMTVVLLNAGPYALLGIMMAVGGAMVTAVSYSRQRGGYHREVAERERQFKEILAAREAEATTLLGQTQQCLLSNDTHIKGCLELVESRDPRRLWSRIANDHDFLRARLGLGSLPFQVKFELPSQLNQLFRDPFEEAAAQMASRFATVPGVPVLLDLRTVGVSGIAGERAAAVDTAWTIAVQLATHHAPESVRLAAVYPPAEATQWAWLRWLPHSWRADRQRRYLASTEEDAKELWNELAGTLRQRDNQLQARRHTLDGENWPVYYVVIVADTSMLNAETRRLLCERGPSLGFHAIFLAGREAELPRECGAVIAPGPAPTLIVRQKGRNETVAYTADAIDEQVAEEFSRLLAPLQFESTAGTIPNLVGLFDLLGLDRVEDWKVLDQWHQNDSVKSLQVPIGIGAGSRKVMFDIHDDGHGPHGLAAGTSGAGKTRFLECLVAILAAHFHPHELSFMLIDFKGSDFLQSIPDLPHCISVLSSIEGKSQDEQNWHVSRTLKALEAEIKRRQAIYARLKVSKITEYHERRRADPSLEALPRLIIIVDEFAELATQQPEFLDGLVRLARIGRSLGMNLILATQQPAGIVTDQIWANSRFRLSMKFNKTEDSQAVLKRPDAAYIEQRGRGYLQVGENAVFDLFQGPYGGIPYEDPTLSKEKDDKELEVIEIALNGERVVHLKQERPKPKQTQLSALVQHIQAEAERAGIKPVPDLLPAKNEHLTSLDDMPVRGGWNGGEWTRASEWLCPAIGVLDDPGGQLAHRGEPIPMLRPDLGRFGHIFICCDIADHTRLPLRTFVTSLALAHSPADLNFYALDFGNNALSIFRKLPHMGEVLRVTETRRITRLFRWLFTELEQRRELLTPYGVTWAEARRQGLDLQGRPVLVLVVDNLLKWKDEADRRDELTMLVNEGAQNGIHLILAGEARAATLFHSVLSGISPRLALGFADHKEFRDIIDAMSWDRDVLGGMPDRGIYYDMETGAIECRVVTPVRTLDRDEDENQLKSLIDKLAESAKQANMPIPIRIGELPPELPLDDIMPRDVLAAWEEWSRNPSLRLFIGQDDLKLEPLLVDMQEEGPHFMIVGPPKGGKTITLQAWLLSLAALTPPDEVNFVLFDNLRHTLEPLRGLPHVTDTIANDEEAKVLFKHLREQLDDRAVASISPPMLLVFDDISQFDSPTLRTELATLARLGASRGLYVLASGRTADMNKYDELTKALLRYRSGLFVGSHTIESDAAFFDVFLPTGLTKERLPRGRGYLVRQGEYSMLQIATPGDAASVRQRVEPIAAAGAVWRGGKGRAAAMSVTTKPMGQLSLGAHQAVPADGDGG